MRKGGIHHDVHSHVDQTRVYVRNFRADAHGHGHCVGDHARGYGWQNDGGQQGSAASHAPSPKDRNIPWKLNTLPTLM